MRVTSIHGTYIQKSRIFLYPLLSIRRGVSVVPKQTFMAWEGTYELDDYKLICNYHIRKDKEFKLFEEVKLLGNKLFDSYIELEDGSSAYVFDFSKYKKQYDLIIEGKYTNLDNDYKKQILNFFKNNVKNHTMIRSYLYPLNYYEQYAKLYGVPVDLLKGVKELCSKPDLKEESFTINKKSFIFDKNKKINQ